ncbi:hypothetical protein GIB67_012639 [Kingdonia uniflora]|uniref:Uncharacterized protein n=1 Tax=Kingdonia uniflora TaxID=39325 RepID=A0A7J7NFH6_9MAGN|nr:hypothetical protein GIB67_012639 [Kingdonia uniflora]
MPRAPAFVEKSGLRFGDKADPYNPKYDWEDLFSEEKWRDSITLMRGRKVYDGIPVCSEGYFEWFNSVSFTKLCPDVVNLGEDAGYDGARVLGASSGVFQRENTSECVFLMEATGRMQTDIEAKNLANSICEKKLNEKTLECETNKKLLKDLTLECESTKIILEDHRLECESNKKLVEDLRMQLATKVNETETLVKINDKLMDEVYVHQIEVPLPLNIVPHPEENVGEAKMWKQKVWRQTLKDPTYEELEIIDSRLKKIDHKPNLRQSLFQPFNWFQLDIRDVERDGNTTFRVAASYVYQSQMKFSNVKISLCTLMTKKPSYWKSVFSQRLDVAYNDLGERRYETLLRAFKFDVVFVEYLYMGHLLATYYEKVVIFINNKEALTFLPLFWPKTNNNITKEKKFENILVDSTKYWWVRMTSDENFVKLKTKYQSPIPPISTLWWAHVKLDIPDAFVKQCVKNYFDASNEAWMKLMKDNNVNSLDYSLNDLILC